MTPLDAVAAAIRERLIAGRPAPLPGLGTLVRQHVSARVEERADGSRVLLPPGETIGLAPAGAAQESLAPAFGRFRALDDDQAAQDYADAMDQIEARLAATGEVRLPGVGLLRRTSGGVVLGVEADLLAAVNRTYEGLTPVSAAPPPEPTAPSEMADDGPDDLLNDGPDDSADDDSADDDSAENGPADDGPADDDEAPPPTSASAPFEEAPEESPLRDLSSDPGSPFEPPRPPDAPREPAPTRPVPAFEPLALPPDDSASAPERAEITDIDLPDDALFAARPGEGPAPDSDASPTDVSFVDDDTLDADLDDVLAVPFGSGAGLSEVLPPTPEARAPEPDAPPSAPSTDADDWTSETWTAPPSGDAPSLGDQRLDRSFREEAEIEDAEVISDSDAPDDAAGAAVPDDAEEPNDEDGEAAPDVAPVAGPAGEWTPLLGDPPAVPAETEPAVPAETVPSDPDAPDADLLSDREPGAMDPTPADDLRAETAVAAPAPAPASRVPWWAVAGVLLLLAALTALLLWPRLRPDRDDGPTITVQQTAPTFVPSAESERADGVLTDSLTGLGSAGAALPPLVADLPAADQRALAGQEPVRPDADAWTFVVLSTPSREAADALRDRFANAGYRTSVLTASRSTGPMYRLAVGQFASRDDAERLRDRLSPLAPDDTWALDLRTL